MPLTDEQVRDLTAIIDAVLPSPDGPPDEFPVITVGYGEDSWSLAGRGFVAYKRFAGTLASSALGGSGLSVKVAEDLVLAACGRAFRGSRDDAISALNRRLDAPPIRYRVARPLSGYFGGDRFKVGSAVISRGVPEGMAGDPALVADDFPVFSLTVGVDARDEATAAVLADQEVGEILGIFQLYDLEGVAEVGEASVTIRDDGSWSATPATKRRLHIDHAVESNGRLHHYAAALAEAQSTAYAERTDWQRRCLNACRWLTAAMNSPWPSHSLVGLFVALEALFIEAGRHGPKKTIIAERWSERFVSPENREQARSSLIELYDRRNDAAHEALDYRDELEIERLTVRVKRAIFWAAAHLLADHGRRRTPCETIEQVMNCDAQIGQ
jgi:hypothetical protein